MCRLLGYVADAPTDFSDVVGKDFEEFVNLSKIHKDGWGITAPGGVIVKDTGAAVESDEFKKVVSESKNDAALLHFRWATAGMAINQDNSHPFQSGDYSFIHNGSITPAESVDQYLSPSNIAALKTGNDSERYFQLVMKHVAELGAVEGFKAAVELIKHHLSYSSLNAMLISPSELLVVCEYNPDRIPAIGGPDYYELRFKDDGHSVLIGSSGWNQNDWQEIANHTLMVIDRKTRAYRFIPLN